MKPTQINNKPNAHVWGRSQKYHPRDRHLYALLFADGGCYIGQSVDVAQREKQHRSRAGGWGRDFQCVHLGSIHGSEDQAKDYEHAWRHVAAKNGWHIFAKPPRLVVNHRRQMSPGRYLIAQGLKWPREHVRRRGFGIGSAVMTFLKWNLIVLLAIGAMQVLLLLLAVLWSG